jgi:di/tricarboxylate transporter
VFYQKSTVFFILATVYTIGISAGIPAMHPEMTDVDGTKVGFTWKSYFSIELTYLALLLFLNDAPPDLVGLAISITLVLFQVVTIDDAIAGFSSSSVLAIGVLFVVAKGLENTGAITKILLPVMGESKNLTVSLLRMTFPVAIMSAFMNNTPVVAMMIPVIQQWAPRIGHSPKKFLIPLSFASMLGGTLTLLGTSTNLVLQDLAEQSCDDDTGFIMDTNGLACVELNIFTMMPVGICMIFSGLLFLAATAGCLLPGDAAQSTERKELEESKLANHYPLEMVVEEDSALLGKDLMGAGMLTMDGLTVVSISTKVGEIDTSRKLVTGDELDTYQLAAGDIIHLAVKGDTVSQIRALPGLIDHVTMQHDLEQLGAGRRHRRMFEVVISNYCPLNGMPVHRAKSKCWEMYNAVIYTRRVSSQAMADTKQTRSRTGSQADAFKEAAFVPLNDNSAALNPGAPTELQEMRSSSSRQTGDVVQLYSQSTFYSPRESEIEVDDGSARLSAGDCLLVEAFENFGQKNGASVHFLSCRLIKGSAPPRRNTYADVVRTWGSGLLLGLMVGAVASGLTDILTGATTISILLVCMQCLSIDEAFGAIKGRVVLAIVMTYSLGTALKEQYVALLIAQYLKALGVMTGPIGLLACMFLATALLSCIVSNQVHGILCMDLHAMHPSEPHPIERTLWSCKCDHLLHVRTIVLMCSCFVFGAWCRRQLSSSTLLW